MTFRSTVSALAIGALWAAPAAAAFNETPPEALGVIDARAMGCAADGATDAGACINALLTAYPGCVSIPPTTLGFYVTTPIVVKRCLIGSAFDPINPGTTTVAFPGMSWLKCNVGSNACVTAGVTASLGHAPIVENLILAGQGTPASGGMGFQVVGDYNTQTRNLYAYNFDTCYEYGPGSTAAPISVFNYNSYLAACQTHYVVIDGSPEIRFIGGRWGANGTGDYATAKDFVYQTLTTTVGVGGGPNTVLIEDVQMNPGSGGGVACAFRWGGYTGSGGVQGETRLTNLHVEWHSYSGSATQGVFCSDSTVPTIADLFVDSMLTATSGLTVPLFALDPATTPSQWFFAHNQFGCSGVTLNTGAPSSSGASNLHFDHNDFCGSVSFTAGNSNATLFATGNSDGALTLAGQWAALSIADSFTGLSDSATGHVAMGQVNPESSTPSLKFGGANTGITTSTDTGGFARTTEGGYIGYAAITLTSKGTATGAATITGAIKYCASGAMGAAVQVASGFTGLTGVLQAVIDASTTNQIDLVQSGSSGVSAVTDANFTNMTSLQVSVECLRTN